MYVTGKQTAVYFTGSNEAGQGLLPVLQPFKQPWQKSYIPGNHGVNRFHPPFGHTTFRTLSWLVLNSSVFG